MAHQFHAKLMGFVLGMRTRRQSKVAPPVWDKLLLMQLSIQATGECNLEIYTSRLWFAYRVGRHSTKAEIKL